MATEAERLAATVLSCLNESPERDYIHRVSSVSRCLRDAVMHAHGEAWSNPPQAQWGTQAVFDQGHDAERRVLKYMKDAAIHVACEQMAVKATTPMGLDVSGHIDAIVLVPEGLPLGGKWFLMDVKSIGSFGYRMMRDQQSAKPDHVKQVSIYAMSQVDDDKYESVKGVTVNELSFDGYEFGGGMVVYFAKERPTKGYGDKKKDLPKIHIEVFDVDSYEVEGYLDFFDEIQIHVNEGTIPNIPDQSDEMVWGRYDKALKRYRAIRCDSRWCYRYDVCRGSKEPSSDVLKEIL